MGEWIISYAPGARAEGIHLVCIPFAGGGSLAFRGWSERLPRGIQVHAVQLPGRERRWHEPTYQSVGPVVDGVLEALERFRGAGVALFGHSYGAIIAFELARRMNREWANGPVHLFPAGRIAPHLRSQRPPIHNLPTPGLIARLHALGGTPAEILANAELMDALLPTLRADLAAAEQYEYIEGPPLDCPVTAFSGSGDEEASGSAVAAWSRHTTARFAHVEVAGGHFFINGPNAIVLKHIAWALLGPEPTGNQADV